MPEIAPRHWADIAYLRSGNARQQAAHKALTDLGVFEALAAYNPILVGTIPIALDLPESDLDIICEVYDLAAFERALRLSYSGMAGFRLKRRERNDLPVVICEFDFGGFPVQIFGQPRPRRLQNAYRHMLIEARLLALGDDDARTAIRALKANGLKTEPAFARYFDLPGDPYQTLLALADESDEALQRMQRTPRHGPPFVT